MGEGCVAREEEVAVADVIPRLLLAHQSAHRKAHGAPVSPEQARKGKVAPARCHDHQIHHHEHRVVAPAIRP